MLEEGLLASPSPQAPGPLAGQIRAGGAGPAGEPGALISQKEQGRNG